MDNIPRFNVKHTFFKNSFFPSNVIEWINLDKNIKSSESFALFKKSILKFVRPTPNRTFNCHNPNGIKLITRLKLRLSQSNYLLHCPIFSNERSIFFQQHRSIDEDVLSGSDSRISEMLLFGISPFSDTENTSILNTTIDYIL